MNKSETLNSLGFTKKPEGMDVVLPKINSGEFYHPLDHRETIAKDEQGNLWAKNGVIDLVPQGFTLYAR